MKKDVLNKFIDLLFSWNNRNSFLKVMIWLANLLYVFLFIAILSLHGNWGMTYICTLFLVLVMGISYTIEYIHQYIDVIGKNGKDVQNLLELNLPSSFFLEEYYNEIEERARKNYVIFVFVLTIEVFLAQMINWFHAFKQVFCLTIAVAILLLVICVGSLRYYRWRLKHQD